LLEQTYLKPYPQRSKTRHGRALPGHDGMHAGVWFSSIAHCSSNFRFSSLDSGLQARIFWRTKISGLEACDPVGR